MAGIGGGEATSTVRSVSVLLCRLWENEDLGAPCAPKRPGSVIFHLEGEHDRKS